MFKKRKAFTLIELLVVIAIIGILAAIALSATQTARKRAADAKNKSDAQTIQKAWVTYSSDNNLFWTPTGATAAQLTFATTNLTGLAGASAAASLAHPGARRHHATDALPGSRRPAPGALRRLPSDARRAAARGSARLGVRAALSACL